MNVTNFELKLMKQGNRFSFGSVTGRRVGSVFSVQKIPMGSPFPSISQDFLNAMRSYEAAGEVEEILKEQFHRSRPTVDTAYESVMKFSPNKHSDNMHDRRAQVSVQIAIAQLDAMLCHQVVEPIERKEMYENGLQYLQEPSASAGYPHVFGASHSKRYVLENNMDTFLKLSHHMKRDGDIYRAYAAPCIVYQKSSVSNIEKEKVRLIWGYPLEMTMVETMFARPWMEKCKQLEQTSYFPTAYTFSPFNGAYVRYMHQVQRTTDAQVTVRDFSSYDSTVPEFVIRAVFDLLKKHTNLGYGSKYKKMSNIWDNMVDYFVHTPILIPQTAALFVKHHGIPSGSMFTSLVGSLCNFVMTAAASLYCGAAVRDMHCMGDDNISTTPIPFDKVNRALELLFGVEINDSKCYYGPVLGATFLGRKFTENGLGWSRLSRYSILALAYPSSKDDELSFATRAFMIYVDNPCCLTYHFAKITSKVREKFGFSFKRDDNRMVRMTMMLDSLEQVPFLSPERLITYFSSKYICDDA